MLMRGAFAAVIYANEAWEVGVPLCLMLMSPGCMQMRCGLYANESWIHANEAPMMLILQEVGLC
jgi:hypothetical protein